MSPVSPFEREGSPSFYVRREVKGVGRIVLSTGTTSAARARQLDQLVLDTRVVGRLDALRALRDKRVSFADLNAHRTPAQLDALLARASAPRR